jgi:SagB-type dehydrogenase family enzyme
MSGINDMVQFLVLSFKEGTTLLKQPDGDILVQSPDMQVRLTQSSPGLLAAVHSLSSEGATIEQLVELAAQHDGVAGLPRFLSYLQRFIKSGLVCQTVPWPGGKLATLVPTSSAYRWESDEPAVNERYVISRFAYLHKESGRFVLASPLAHANIILHDWRTMALLHSLAQPCSLKELCDISSDVPPVAVAMFVRLLLGCQALSGLRNDGKPAEETPTLIQWDFHDLLFHARSRMGRHNHSYGATFRFLDKISPLPAVKPPMSSEAISLFRPDIQALKDNDIPFTRVLEERRSIRVHGGQHITAAQLGEFLYRAARVRELPEAAEGPYERSDRSYPSGGACYELELYVVVNVCAELPSGLYHYCPKEHQLYRVTGRTREVEALLRGAYSAAGQQGMPQILLILAARFQRVAWKYEAMAYALILKHVGVLYQSMYLIATVMGLAACALGGGNSDLFAAATGIDYYVETSIGEFMLGNRMEGTA